MIFRNPAVLSEPFLENYGCWLYVLIFIGVNLEFILWYKPRDHVVKQPTIKIKIWSRKVKRDLIGVWHNGNMFQGTNTIGIKLNDTMKPVNI
jgi:hypothetical protein